MNIEKTIIDLMRLVRVGYFYSASGGVCERRNQESAMDDWYGKADDVAKEIEAKLREVLQCQSCPVTQEGYSPSGVAVQIQEPAQLAAVQQGVQPVPNVQSTAPEVIHLNIGPDAEDCDFKDLHEVTWCDHDATYGSIQYVRADLATNPTQQGLDAECPYKHAIEEICVGGVRTSLKDELFARAAEIAAQAKQGGV